MGTDQGLLPRSLRADNLFLSVPGSDSHSHYPISYPRTRALHQTTENPASAWAWRFWNEKIHIFPDIPNLTQRRQVVSEEGLTNFPICPFPASGDSQPLDSLCSPPKGQMWTTLNCLWKSPLPWAGVNPEQPGNGNPETTSADMPPNPKLMKPCKTISSDSREETVQREREGFGTPVGSPVPHAISQPPRERAWSQAPLQAFSPA